MECLHSAPTPTAGTPKTSPSSTPQLTAQGPSQLLTALLARLPDATNRAGIDQVAVEFAFLNSKAARKRLVRVSTVDTKGSLGTLMSFSHFVVSKPDSEESNRLVAPLRETCSDLEQIHAGRWV